MFSIPKQQWIGFTGASQNRELLEFTRAFRRDHPDVRLDFRKDTFDGCRRQLLDGSVDWVDAAGSRRPTSSSQTRLMACTPS